MALLPAAQAAGQEEGLPGDELPSASEDQPGEWGELPADADPEIDGSYIVVLQEPAEGFGTAAAEELATGNADEYDIEPDQVYSHALAGYSAELTPEQVAQLEADPQVAYVEPDALGELQQSDDEQVVPTGVRRTFAADNPNLGIGGSEDLRMDVDIAIIDSGVADHPDLNLVDRVDCTGIGGCTSGGGHDVTGHGTHVAGSAAAINNDQGVVGTAPGARLWSQKVCPRQYCTASAVIAGIDYVTAHADEIEVANVSLGFTVPNQAMDDAIAASVDAGIVYVVAAGNAAADAAGFHPASHPDVITVSALSDSDGLPGGLALSCDWGDDDHLATLSNWGAVVNVAAPGICIASTAHDGGYEVRSGTSMASPYVAGAVGLLTSGDDAPADRAGVTAVRDTIEATGNDDWTWVSQGPGDFQEPLLDVGDTDVYDPAISTDPVASIDVTCDDAGVECSFDGAASYDPGGGSIESWNWHFGDETTGTGPTVSHTYYPARRRTVTLTVTTSDGRQSVAVRDVGRTWNAVSQLPDALATSSTAGVQCSTDPGGYYQAGWRYDYATDTWTELPSSPAGLDYHGTAMACTEDGQLHVLGGGSGANAHYVYDTGTGAWREGAPVPGPASYAAAGAWGGKVYVVGGSSSKSNPWGTTDEVKVYDVSTDAWHTNAPALPESASRSGYTQSGHYLYVVGGLHAPGSDQTRYAVDTVLRFDMTTGSWSEGPRLRDGNFSVGLVATDVALYALGGWGWNGTTIPHPEKETVERLPLSEWVDGDWVSLDTLPKPRSFTGVACGTANGETVISVVGGASSSDHLQMTVPDESCGHFPAWSSPGDILSPDPATFPAVTQCPGDPDGYYQFAGQGSSNTWRYDFADGSWTSLAVYPGGVTAGLTAACTDDGRIHVMGGPGGSGTDHYVYDLAADTWEEAEPVPRVASYAASAAWNGKVYLVGGADGFTGQTDQVNVYDIATDSWSTGAPAPGPVASAGFVQSGSTLYLAGGRTGGNPNVTDSLSRFDLVSGTWSEGPSLAAPTSGGTLVATDSALYLVGGIRSGSHTKATERLDLDAWDGGSWTALGSLPNSRAYATGACGTVDGVAILLVSGGLGTDSELLQQSTRAGEACAL
jgi:subtilisin family serine protease/N-acetylneuraminic acid mutarotase